MNKNKLTIFLVVALMPISLLAETPEEKLAGMGIELVEPDPPAGLFVPAVTSGKLVFLSGHGPRKPDGGFVAGKVGSDISIEEGQLAARYTCIALLASLKQEIGELSRVKRIVRVFGMVNVAEGFNQTHTIINGCSQLLIDIWGDNGRHARAAVGMAELPFDIAVEIEMVVELK
ncbi:MAG: RidA family protein [Gammaproteobacteria bacterium]|nr:RidA family protein [Gammaproteobacteria bacterium]